MGSVFNRCGGTGKLITKNITANGTYNAASDNAAGYSNVNVNVPLIAKNITANGTYNAASDNAAGYSNVNVNVPAIRNLLWSGNSAGNVSVDLSGYNWVYIVITPGDAGATGCQLLLRVGGSALSAGIYRPVGDSARQYGRIYQATPGGITALTDNSDGMYYITAVYGISNLV